MTNTKFLKFFIIVDVISMLILTILWAYDFYRGYDSQLYFRVFFLLIGYIRITYYTRKFIKLKAVK
ncbi:hypothetical protein CXK86_01525 [Paenibacillus sp. BGI2013]|nr:hypothetical protein CXK86_01525 [Paenibacillus sp. BGI2013]